MVKLESVQDDKIEQIIIFLANFENQKRGEDFWRRRLKFWWEDNPCYNSNFCRGWILVENKENIVGFLGNIPLWFLVNGEAKLVNNATTWMVLNEYRSYSILLFQEIIKNSNSTILFDTTPNPKVEKVLNFFNFNKLDVGKATVIPINIARQTTNKYLKKIRPIVPLLNVFISVFNKLFLSHSKKFNCKIITSDEISIYFDDLWNKTKQNFSNTLIRDSKTIRWYFDNQHSFEKVLICCFEDEEMIGYGIFKIRGNSMVLVDFWSVRMNFDILKSIAKEAFYHCKKINIKWLYFIHFNNHIKKMFEKLYPYEKKNIIQNYITKQKFVI